MSFEDFLTPIGAHEAHRLRLRRVAYHFNVIEPECSSYAQSTRGIFNALLAKVNPKFGQESFHENVVSFCGFRVTQKAKTTQELGNVFFEIL